MRRILFISAFDYPTRFAHARHGLEMAQAYNNLPETEFLFLVNTAKQELPVPYLELFGRFGRRIKKMRLRRVLLPFRLMAFFIARRTWCDAIVVTTDPAFYALLGLLKVMFGFRLVIECHGALSMRQKAAVRKADLAVCTTVWLMEKFGVARRNVHLANAVNVPGFDVVSDDMGTLRTELSLPRDVLLVGYIGRFEPLGMDKGIRFLIDMLTAHPEMHLLLVGGAPRELAEMREYLEKKEYAPRVHLVGLVESRDVARFAKACDVLAYVPTANNSFFAHETSPMKVFEYMAARRPIILSDTPALREILSDDAAFFIQPGSATDFSEVVRIVRGEEGSRRAQVAYEAVRTNTWENRARKIVQEVDRVL